MIYHMHALRLIPSWWNGSLLKYPGRNLLSLNYVWLSIFKTRKRHQSLAISCFGPWNPTNIYCAGVFLSWLQFQTSFECSCTNASCSPREWCHETEQAGGKKRVGWPFSVTALYLVVLNRSWNWTVRKISLRT